MDSKHASRAPSPEAFARAGTPRLLFQAATSAKLGFIATTTCVQCGTSMHVRYGEVAAVFRIGGEFVGCCCEACLSPESRARLARLREVPVATR